MIIFSLFYDHQPSSPSVVAAETALGVGDGALEFLYWEVYLDLGVTGVTRGGSRQGAWIESRTEGCGGVATRTSLVVPLCWALGVPARL